MDEFYDIFSETIYYLNDEQIEQCLNDYLDRGGVLTYSMFKKISYYLSDSMIRLDNVITNFWWTLLGVAIIYNSPSISSALCPSGIKKIMPHLAQEYCGELLINLPVDEFYDIFSETISMTSSF